MQDLILKLKQNPFLAYSVIPPMAKMVGKEMQTTYYNDFLVCLEKVGAIRDTYHRALPMAKADKVYGTELALALNWLCWDFAEYNRDVAKVYDELWREWDAWVMDNYKGDDLQYYLRETD